MAQPLFDINALMAQQNAGKKGSDPGYIFAANSTPLQANPGNNQQTYLNNQVIANARNAMGTTPSRNVYGSYQPMPMESLIPSAMNTMANLGNTIGQGFGMANMISSQNLQAQYPWAYKAQMNALNNQTQSQLGNRQLDNEATLNANNYSLGNRGLDIQSQLGQGSLDLQKLLGTQQYDLGNKNLDIQKLLGLGQLDVSKYLGDQNYNLGNKGLDVQSALGNKGLDIQSQLGQGQLGLGSQQLNMLGTQLGQRNQLLGQLISGLLGSGGIGGLLGGLFGGGGGGITGYSGPGGSFASLSG